MKTMKMMEVMMNGMYNQGYRVNTNRVKNYNTISLVIMGITVVLLSTIYASITNFIIAITLLVTMVVESYLCNYMIDWKPINNQPVVKISVYDSTPETDMTTPLQEKLSQSKEEILNLRSQGRSYESIAKQYNCSRTTMTKFIKSNM